MDDHSPPSPNPNPTSTHRIGSGTGSSEPAGGVAAWAERSVPALVAEVYEAAPPVERGRLVEQLLRPLGVLSLCGIAGGIFASIRFRSGWQEMHVRPEDLAQVRSSQVMALVDHAQQVSVETVDGLAQMLASSPALSGTAATAVLVAVLVRRARARQNTGAAAEAPTVRGSCHRDALR
jgi:hypothetical protein